MLMKRREEEEPQRKPGCLKGNQWVSPFLLLELLRAALLRVAYEMIAHGPHWPSPGFYKEWNRPAPYVSRIFMAIVTVVP